MCHASLHINHPSGMQSQGYPAGGCPCFLIWNGFLSGHSRSLFAPVLLLRTTTLTWAGQSGPGPLSFSIFFYLFLCFYLVFLFFTLFLKSVTIYDVFCDLSFSLVFSFLSLFFSFLLFLLRFASKRNEAKREKSFCTDRLEWSSTLEC